MLGFFEYINIYIQEKIIGFRRSIVKLRQILYNIYSEKVENTIQLD